MVISNYIGVCTVEVGKNSFHCKKQLKNVLGKGSRKKGDREGMEKHPENWEPPYQKGRLVRYDVNFVIRMAYTCHMGK